MRTYPKDDGVVEVMEEDIEVRTQVVLFFWSRLWEAFVVFYVERGRDSPEHPANCETWKGNEVRWTGYASYISLLELVMSKHRRRVVDYRSTVGVFARVTALTVVSFSCCVASAFRTQRSPWMITGCITSLSGSRSLEMTLKRYG